MFENLEQLIKIIREKKNSSPDKSYTNKLLNDKNLSVSKVKEEIGELKKGQDKLKKEIASIKSAAPANANKGVASKGAKKNVPIGNSMVLGKADAPVTITKWTDFQ